jgi:hypothetical protein
MYPYAEGKSTLNPVTTREGIVLKLGKERLEPKIKDGRLILKLVSETHTLNK